MGDEVTGDAAGGPSTVGGTADGLEPGVADGLEPGACAGGAGFAPGRAPPATGGRAAVGAEDRSRTSDRKARTALSAFSSAVPPPASPPSLPWSAGSGPLPRPAAGSSSARDAGNASGGTPGADPGTAGRACSAARAGPAAAVSDRGLRIVSRVCCVTVSPADPRIVATVVTVMSRRLSGTASSTSTDLPVAATSPTAHTATPSGSGVPGTVLTGHSTPLSTPAGLVTSARRASVPGPSRRTRKRITSPGRLHVDHTPAPAAATRSRGDGTGSSASTAYTADPPPRTSTPAPKADTIRAPRHHTATASLRSPGTDTRHRYAQ
ncbi:hypothetical protein GCM10010517_54630 [Streptosporangium fragile]|uniref:Uncharacterized protein n=1 Tax=Streptosporangium fragile TaxID=46186 RepID=A0ABP6IJT3_9ACTN